MIWLKYFSGDWALNKESLYCQEQYLLNSIKDQQRKILVVQKLCDLIEDQATSANDMSFDSQELKQLVGQKLAAIYRGRF